MNIIILVGRYSSPFVRRVGFSLRLLDLPYELKPISTLNDRDEVRRYNPLGRVPALVLENGEVLIDSAPILDHIDQTVGPERALVPAQGAERRHVLKLVAYGMGAMEKTLACFIERNLRPAGTRHTPLLERFADQAEAGLAMLNQAAAGEAWMLGDRPSQADITAICALDFLRHSWPERAPAGQFPALDALSERAHRLPAFAETKPQ